MIETKARVESRQDQDPFESYLAATNLTEVNASVENWPGTQSECKTVAYPDDDFEIDWKCKFTFAVILVSNLTILGNLFI
ncbi:MAG: hypothetical protein HRT89_02955 [Lentisphaeria bacterium]|nr:hypothetical protein [Lentisphaeria bacterium]NQZ67008.1 hypothetical protein [Lentisphaeria bacterium]